MKAAQLMGLLQMDRQTALRHLQLVVETRSPQQLDEYERDLLVAYGALFLQKQRIRAMELYAGFKMAETMHYSQFRGFVGTGEPVA
jgi:hypothetical protein